MLPFTFFIMLLASLMTLQSAEKYYSEKVFFREAVIAYQLESLFFIGIKSWQNDLDQGVLPFEGRIDGDVGYVIYKTKEETENELILEVAIHTFSGGAMEGDMHIDKNEREIIRWRER